MNLTPKETLKLFNRKQMSLFPRSTRKKLTIYPTSRIPKRVFSGYALTLHKKDPIFLGLKNNDLEKDSPQHNIEFIVQDSHRRDKPPTSDKEIMEHPAESFVWHTSQENIHKALFYGIMRPDSLGFTAKVINELGKYRLIALDRIYEKGIISNKYEQKDAFLRIAQERIEALQGLERMVNNYNIHATVDENYDRFIEELDTYIAKLKAIKIAVNENKHICGYENKAAGYLNQNINYDIEETQDFKKRLKNRKNKGRLTERYLRNYIYAATGVSSTLEFVKERMIYSIRSMQAHNEVMTRARSAMAFFVGDINGVAEDALKIINDYQPDLHNLTLHAHQGIFVSPQSDEVPEKEKTVSQEERFDDEEEFDNNNNMQNEALDKKNKLITVDFSYLENNTKAINHAKMAICVIEKEDEIVREKDEHNNFQYKLKHGEKEQNLLTTRFTNWAINKKPIFVFERTFAWFLNVLTGILAGLLCDLWVGFAAGCVNKKPPFCLAEMLRWTPENPDDIETGFHKLERETKKTQSLGTKFGKLIGNFVRNTVFEFLEGAKIVFRGFTFEFIDGLKSDWNIGHYGIPDEVDLQKKVLEELDGLKAKNKDNMEEIEKTTNSFIPEEERALLKGNFAKKITTKEINTLSANAPFEQSPGEFKDIGNSIINGVNIFGDAFIHEIGAKHPFTWEVFLALYVFGGFAVMAPTQMAALLGPGYVAFSNTLGATVGKSTISKAISSALYQAQLSTLAMDTIINGNSGMLANGLMALESDPSNIIMYTGAAFLLGWLIAFQFHIPWLSQEIVNDLGTVPPAALTVAGAKVGILLWELLEAEETNVHDIPKNLDRRERYKHLIKHQYPEISDEELNEKMDEILDDKLEESLFYIRLEKNKELLPYLDHSTKRELLELMTNKYRGHPEMRNAMVNMLFPKNNQSILVVTLTTIFNYLPMIARCFLTIFTWTKEPWIQLSDSLIKDFTRIFYGLNKIINAVANFLNVTLRGLCNVFFHKVLGRTEGLIMDKDQVFAHAGHTIAARWDCTWHRIRELLATPTDYMRKHCTTPHSSKLAQFEVGKFAHGFFGKGNVPEQGDHDFDDGLEMEGTAKVNLRKS